MSVAVALANSRVMPLNVHAFSPARLLSSEAAAHAQPSDDAAVEASSEYVPVPFVNYSNIHPNTLRAIKQVMQFESASKVQDQLISRMPINSDIMVKAKTGTGKTLAFLVPAIETLAKEYESDPQRARKGKEIGCLIVSPTRELAKQIATEAEKLAKFHSWDVQLLVGGESTGGQLRRLRIARSDIVVATPGRLLDFLKNQPEFAQKAATTRMLVLDEADMLLDLGFRQELESLVRFIPQQRQTFLVSATLSRNVRQLASSVFSGQFDLVDCVDKEDANTHANVKQEYVPVPHSQTMPVMYDLIQTHIAANKAEGRGSKIVVFFPTVKATS
ncbi:hypothetical protein IWW55_006903, partial [Coemansia sp. RSA 2706]